MINFKTHQGLGFGAPRPCEVLTAVGAGMLRHFAEFRAIMS